MPPGERPVVAGGEVNGLVDHRVARPGAQLARRAVDVRVERAQVYRPETDLEDPIQQRVAALEAHGFGTTREEAFLHGYAELEGSRRPYGDDGMPAAHGVEALVSV